MYDPWRLGAILHAIVFYQGIVYDTIINRNMMVKLGLSANFKRQLFHLDGATSQMKQPRDMMGQTDLTSREIHEVVMQTSKLVSTREATERLVKTFANTYAESDLEQVVANATQLNYEEITQLLRHLKYFEGLFDGTLEDWDTETDNLELKPDSKPFNCKYYLVHIINKETFCKDL